MVVTRSVKLAGIIRSIAASYAIQVPPDVATVVSINSVSVSSDLGYADLAVSAISGSDKAVQFLKRHAGEMRKELSTKVSAYKLPQFRFSVDTHGERASRVDAILSKLAALQPAVPEPEKPLPRKKAD